MLKTLLSNETLCVNDPDTSPTVDVILSVDLVTLETKHRTPVALTHSVDSHAVIVTRALRVVQYKANCPPITVTLTEPVVGAFVAVAEDTTDVE